MRYCNVTEFSSNFSAFWPSQKAVWFDAQTAASVSTGRGVPSCYAVLMPHAMLAKLPARTSGETGVRVQFMRCAHPEEGDPQGWVCGILSV